eukprot:2472664-Prymnesium_polylepis.1
MDDGMRLHLRCRAGLEGVLVDELSQCARGLLRRVEVRPRCVAVAPLRTFTLRELYQLRCFDTCAFVLDQQALPRGRNASEAVAQAIASRRCERLLMGLTRRRTAALSAQPGGLRERDGRDAGGARGAAG